MATRKKYSKEFKLDAVSLVTDQGYTRIEAARSLDINANMLGRWVKEQQADDGQAFRGNGKLTPEQEELRNLKAQVKRLQMEKDILKKATVFLSIGSINTLSHHTHHHWDTVSPTFHPDQPGIFSKSQRTTVKIRPFLPAFPPMPAFRLTDTLSSQHVAAT